MAGLKEKIGVLEEGLYGIFPNLYETQGEIIVKLLKYSENITFLVTEPDLGRKRVFRINRPNSHDTEEIMGEIRWMGELGRDTDLILPRIFQGRNREYIQTFFCGEDTYTGICVSFLEGKIMGELEGEALCQQMREMGCILAKLHVQSQNRDEKIPLRRPSWGLEDILGAEGRWGNWRKFNKMNQNQRITLEKLEFFIKKRLEQYGTTHDKYGMIHADLHCSNVIVWEGKTQIFDFDDCGYGWYLYDFGCTLVEYSRPQTLAGYILEGYESVKKLTEEEKSLIPMFVLLRKMVRLAWIAGHSDNDTVKGISQEYYDETFRMAEEFLKIQE